MRVLGIDPGLRNMGWGIIDVKGNKHINQYMDTGIVNVEMAMELGHHSSNWNNSK